MDNGVNYIAWLFYDIFWLYSDVTNNDRKNNVLENVEAAEAPSTNYY